MGLEAVQRVDAVDAFGRLSRGFVLDVGRHDAEPLPKIPLGVAPRIEASTTFFLLHWLTYVSTRAAVGALANGAFFVWRDRANFNDLRLDVRYGAYAKQMTTFAAVGLDDDVSPLDIIGSRSRSGIKRRWRGRLHVRVRQVHVIVLLRLVLVATVFEVANLIGMASQRRSDKSNDERKPLEIDHRNRPPSALLSP
jgi:hypothetical protein